MKIVFLDAYTLNSLHDLDLSVFDTLGEVTLYDRTTKDSRLYQSTVFGIDEAFRHFDKHLTRRIN